MTDAPPFSVADLEAIVRTRLSGEGAPSYTRSLAKKGVGKCAEKFGEEAVEAIVAAVQKTPDALTKEAADVVFHLTVLLAVSGVSWQAVMDELRTRTAQSGLEEKAKRLAP
ncbi:MAG: phosphoribosyl-ATP diphosphatase [Pseudomonadota bacterium]